MRSVFMMAMMLSVTALACSDAPLTTSPDVVEPLVESAAPTVDYTEWSAEQTGTTAKPAYDKGCRYRAGEESVWQLAADGADDRLSIVGEAAGEINVVFDVVSEGASVLIAEATFERVLSGKAYYKASGTMTHEGEGWTLLDGTLCFESSVVNATGDVAAEFSLIASRESDNTLRTVGGTFILPSDKVASSTALDISDDAIALDLR